MSAITGGIQIAFTGSHSDADITPILKTTDSVSFVTFMSADGSGNLIVATNEGLDPVLVGLESGESSSLPEHTTLYWSIDIPSTGTPYMFVTQVPEPASLAVLGFGLAMLAGVRSRRTAA